MDYMSSVDRYEYNLWMTIGKVCGNFVHSLYSVLFLWVNRVLSTAESSDYPLVFRGMFLENHLCNYRHFPQNPHPLLLLNTFLFQLLITRSA